MSAPTVKPLRSNPPQPSVGLLVASTLCWLWGILTALGGVAIFIPAVTSRGIGSRPALGALAFGLLGVPYCAAGYLVRKRRLVGGLIAVVTAGLLFGLQLIGGGATAVDLVVNLAIVVLVLMNWRYLRPSGGHVGA